MIADIKINGVEKTLVLSTEMDITDMLKAGKNDIEITLTSSLRNLFGPHHRAKDPEPVGTGPDSFHMRGTWENGIAPNYTHNYNCMPFGLDEIVVKKVK